MGELTDKIKGTANETIGKIKRESDDPQTRAEGDCRKPKGDLPEGQGEGEGAFGNKI